MSFFGRKSLEQRLMEKVAVDPITGCWNWIGAKDSNGYGNAFYEGKFHKPHRLMAFLKLGLDLNDSGTLVLHKCDNSSCINPDHLEIGNQSKNVGDRFSRHPLEYCHNGHKLTEDNLYRYPGRKMCKTCALEKSRRANESKKLYRQQQKETKSTTANINNTTDKKG